MEDQIPRVEIYTSDKIWLLAMCAVTAGMYIMSAADPTSGGGWVKYIAGLIVSVGMPLLSRLIPTPKQAGAMRFNSEAVGQLSEFKVDQIVAAVEKKDALRTGAIPSVTP